MTNRMRMASDEPGLARKAAGWLLMLLVMAAASVSAGMFLPKQSLWVDETTQLTGVALGPARVVRWLAGRERIVGVPPDRMPPGSYWAQQAWASVFGLSIPALRMFGVFCATLAAGLVFAAGRRAFGTAAGAVGGLLFALSPNVANLAVEIRAYPLFLLVSSAGFYALVRSLCASARSADQRIADDAGAGSTSLNRTDPIPAPHDHAWLSAMVAASIIAIYVHFFGLVLAGALLVAAWTGRRRLGAKIRPILLGAAAVALAAGGLVPLVKASAGVSAEAREEANRASNPANPANTANLKNPTISVTMAAAVAATPARDSHDDAETNAGRLYGLARLAYRLIGHPALQVSRFLTAASLLAAVSLAACAAWIAFAAGRATPNAPPAISAADPVSPMSPALPGVIALALLAGLVAGLLVVGAAQFAVRSFAAASPHYNAWMLPTVCLLLAAPLSSVFSSRPVQRASAAPIRRHWPRFRGIVWIAAGVLLMGDVYACGQLAFHGQYFSHGPYLRLADLIRDLGPDHLALIDDGSIAPDGAITGPALAGGVYFPTHYLFGDTPPQYLLVAPRSSSPGGSFRLTDARLRPFERKQAGGEVSVESLGKACLVVVQSREMSAAEVARQIRQTPSLKPGGDEPSPQIKPGPLAAALRQSPKWRMARSQQWLALIGLRVDVFESVVPEVKTPLNPSAAMPAVPIQR